MGPLVGVGLPDSFATQVQQDAEEIGVAVAELIPNAKKLILKLELMNQNCCMRWHQDNYVARTIVSYNCSGTEYILFMKGKLFPGSVNGLVHNSPDHVYHPNGMIK